tara:strand:- start:340 stop:645 length:306 start_codon:yes stop_codon:yes gene_type:complete
MIVSIKINLTRNTRKGQKTRFFKTTTTQDNNTQDDNTQDFNTQDVNTQDDGRSDIILLQDAFVDLTRNYVSSNFLFIIDSPTADDDEFNDPIQDAISHGAR